MEQWNPQGIGFSLTLVTGPERHLRLEKVKLSVHLKKTESTAPMNEAVLTVISANYQASPSAAGIKMVAILQS